MHVFVSTKKEVDRSLPEDSLSIGFYTSWESGQGGGSSLFNEVARTSSLSVAISLTNHLNGGSSMLWNERTDEIDFIR